MPLKCHMDPNWIPKRAQPTLQGKTKPLFMEKAPNHFISKPKSQQLGNDRPQKRNSAKKHPHLPMKCHMDPKSIPKRPQTTFRGKIKPPFYENYVTSKPKSQQLGNDRPQLRNKCKKLWQTPMKCHVDAHWTPQRPKADI